MRRIRGWRYRPGKVEIYTKEGRAILQKVELTTREGGVIY